jgi:hypothetical protein
MSGVKKSEVCRVGVKLGALSRPYPGKRWRLRIRAFSVGLKKITSVISYIEELKKAGVWMTKCQKPSA